MYKIMNETNWPEEHTTQLSLEQANELLKDLEDTFPNEQYSIWIDKYEPKKERRYNNNAIDGWEDMFPSYD
jgi:hypothetical protein